MLALAPALVVLFSSGAPEGAEAVSVTLREVKPLRLATEKVGPGKSAPVLSGKLEIEVENRGDRPVALEHLDVHGLELRNESTGALHHIIHPCDCAFLLGNAEPPANRRFTLGPGEKRVLVLEEWSCKSAWVPPPAGTYSVRYRLLKKERKRQAGSDEPVDRARCEGALASAELWEGAVTSSPITVKLGKKR